MTENKELLIQKLEAVTDAWKRLYEEPVPKGTWSLRFEKTANINLQLKWGIKEGILKNTGKKQTVHIPVL